jgi:hypothetical protein
MVLQIWNKPMALEINIAESECVVLTINTGVWLGMVVAI